MGRESGGGRVIDWINEPLGRLLLQRKHTLPVMLAVYASGAACTTDLIERVGGHPGSVIATIRALEYSGVLSRIRLGEGRRKVETRLTLRGLQLVETPIYRWQRLFRKWDRAAD